MCDGQATCSLSQASLHPGAVAVSCMKATLDLTIEHWRLNKEAHSMFSSFLITCNVQVSMEPKGAAPFAFCTDMLSLAKWKLWPSSERIPKSLSSVHRHLEALCAIAIGVGYLVLILMGTCVWCDTTQPAQ